jgi:hypothetical protein
MKVESLNFYLENLLPGVAILINILILLPFPRSSIQNNFMVAELLKSDIILSIGFLSISYLLGLMTAIISRFCIDWLSELFSRPWILRRLSHKTYSQLKASLVSLPSEEQNWRRAWNEAYRASLRYITARGRRPMPAVVGRRGHHGRWRGRAERRGADPSRDRAGYARDSHVKGDEGAEREHDQRPHRGRLVARRGWEHYR